MLVRRLSLSLAALAGLALTPGCPSTPEVSCPTACSGAQMCCDAGDGSGVCVDTFTNVRNCGGCGIDCGAGMTCLLGHCMAAGGDTGIPPRDAGRDAAQSGNCRPQCASGSVCCDTTCVSTSGVASGDGRSDSSFQHCGATSSGCGTACDATTASRCGTPRARPTDPPQCLCGESPPCAGSAMCVLNGGSFSCIDMSTDPMHCGDPPVACRAGEACMQGMCGCAALGVGMRCADTETCTAGGCADTMTDPMNCGSIGNACRAGESCFNGTCGCGAAGTRCMAPNLMGCGEVCCGGTCIQTDDYNCGGCGVACVGPQMCVHNAFGPMVRCGMEGIAVVACEADFDAPPGPDAGVTSDAAVDDAATDDAATDDAATDDAAMDDAAVPG
ncbi:MAG: hypothetical protein U0234_01835 [Sandaracinus sp.]